MFSTLAAGCGKTEYRTLQGAGYTAAEWFTLVQAWWLAHTL